MIKFLHTADLHLGKVFHEHSLIEDQAVMLAQLGEILSDTSYGALLIAGDVYDRSIPSPEAVSLFGSFLGKLRSARPDLAVLMLPGNHDSSSRLGFGRELFAELGIHIAADPAQAVDPVLVVQNGETWAFFLLPFLYPGCLGEEAGLADSPAGEPVRSQGRLAEIAAARLESARIRAVKETGVSGAVLGAHLFTQGGRDSESERIFLGTAEQVDAGLFQGFDYTALGHLHRFQKAGPRAWYSGSPLAYSFDEADQEKVFLSVELDGAEPGGEARRQEEGTGLRMTSLPVKPLRRLHRLRGSFNFFFRDSVPDPAIRDLEKDYLEISLADRGLIENPLALLRPRFPWLLAIKQGEAFALLNADHADTLPETNFSGKKRNPQDDFADFLTGIYGAADPEKVGLFRDLLADLEGGMEL
jgi:exonuclease SbcD